MQEDTANTSNPTRSDSSQTPTHTRKTLHPTDSEETIDTRRLRPISPDEPIVGIEHQQKDEGESYLHVSRRCHVGAIRDRNEDSSFIFTAFADGEESLPMFGIFVVADGMGGHTGGHKASQYTSRLVGQRVIQSLYLPLLAGENTPLPIQGILVGAAIEANNHLYRLGATRNMGTTLTAAIVFGSRLFLAHVGDSRVYLWDNEELNLLTTDHTYVQDLVNVGKLTQEEAAKHPHRNVIYRAVGPMPDLEVDIFTCKLPQKGKLLVCSDGLWGMVEDEDFCRVLSSSDSLDEQANALQAAALNNGGDDNITLVLAAFKF